MSGLEFVFYTLAILISAILILGIVCVIWDAKKLEEENECLKKQVQALKTRRIKREYKKAKAVKKEEEK